MAETSHDDRLLTREARAVSAGVAGALLAGVVMGVVFQFTTDVISVLGSFAGESTPLRGWVVHMGISVVYGLLFGAIFGYPAIADFTASFDLVHWTLLGITYMVMVAAVTLSVLPFVLELPWQTSGGTSPIVGGAAPGITGMLPAAAFGLGHIIFGALLGAVYAILDDRV